MMVGSVVTSDFVAHPYWYGELIRRTGVTRCGLVRAGSVDELDRIVRQ